MPGEPNIFLDKFQYENETPINFVDVVFSSDDLREQWLTAVKRKYLTPDENSAEEVRKFKKLHPQFDTLSKFLYEAPARYLKLNDPITLRHRFIASRPGNNGTDHIYLPHDVPLTTLQLDPVLQEVLCSAFELDHEEFLAVKKRMDECQHQLCRALVARMMTPSKGTRELSSLIDNDCEIQKSLAYNVRMLINRHYSFDDYEEFDRAVKEQINLGANCINSIYSSPKFQKNLLLMYVEQCARRTRRAQYWSEWLYSTDLWEHTYYLAVKILWHTVIFLVIMADITLFFAPISAVCDFQNFKAAAACSALLLVFIGLSKFVYDRYETVQEHYEHYNHNHYFELAGLLTSLKEQYLNKNSNTPPQNGLTFFDRYGKKAIESESSAAPPRLLGPGCNAMVVD